MPLWDSLYMSYIYGVSPLESLRLISTHSGLSLWFLHGIRASRSRVWVFLGSSVHLLHRPLVLGSIARGVWDQPRPPSTVVFADQPQLKRSTLATVTGWHSIGALQPCRSVGDITGTTSPSSAFLPLGCLARSAAIFHARRD